VPACPASRRVGAATRLASRPGTGSCEVVMFTGIIEGQGTVAGLRVAADESAAALLVDAPWLAGQLTVGDSVAVNGCCLTVTRASPAGFAADLVAETLRRTALGRLRPGEGVNLERPLAADGRLGGHVVQGHVDGLGRVLAHDQVGEGAELRVGIDQELARYVVVKGSIAVDGVSLTVAGTGQDWFSVALVPHTLAVTTLGGRQPGDQVQLEVDVLAKYVERLLGPLLPAASGAGGGNP
jgi:riboflavin synthase